MGVSYYCFYGPVLEINNMLVEKTYNKNVCPNGHKVDDHDKFCKTCGSKTETITETKKERMILRDSDIDYDILQNINDDPNRYIFSDYGINLPSWDNDSYEGVTIEESTFLDLKKKFKNDKEVSNLITALSKLYNDQFTINFKMIMYAS